MARKATWIDTIVSFTVANGAQQLVSLMGGMTPVDSRGFTLTRTIIEVSFAPPTAVSDGYQVASYGVGLVSQEAFVAGVVPDPDQAADRPARGWVYRGSMLVAGAANMTSHVPARLEKDIRSQRRVDDGEMIFIMNNGSADGTTFTMTVQGLVRTAYLLP